MLPAKQEALTERAFDGETRTRRAMFPPINIRQIRRMLNRSDSTGETASVARSGVFYWALLHRDIIGTNDAHSRAWRLQIDFLLIASLPWIG